MTPPWPWVYPLYFPLDASGPGPASKSAPLFIRAEDVPTWMANLYLSVRGGGQGESSSLPLVVKGESPTTRKLRLFVKGDGANPGYFPASAPMNLHVERGPQAGMTLYLENHGAAAQATLYIGGVPVASGETTLFVAGDGGTPSGTVEMCIEGVDYTAADGSIDLAIPNAVGARSGTVPLFVGGWESF